jgi:predicted 3-demethylubiquinone-9 3-methyltransferase (glyoxalase superfamily)
VPTELIELLGDPDPDNARKAMQAMLQMKKIDLDALRQAVA